MTEASSYFTAATASEILAAGYVRLLRDFTTAESEPFRSQNPTPAPQGEAAEAAADFKELKDQIDLELDQLMVGRLTAGQRTAPLLRASDTDRVLGKLFEGDAMTQEVIAGMAVSRKIIEVVIAGKINFLAAIDADLYVAFWRFVSAVTSEIIASGSTPSQVVQLPVARAAVYRACMTPASWRKLTTVTLALMSGLSASSLMGGVTGAAVNDEAAAAIDAILAQADDASAASRADYVAKAKGFYLKRGREIWPATRN